MRNVRTCWLVMLAIVASLVAGPVWAEEAEGFGFGVWAWIGEWIEESIGPILLPTGLDGTSDEFGPRIPPTGLEAVGPYIDPTGLEAETPADEFWRVIEPTGSPADDLGNVIIPGG